MAWVFDGFPTTTSIGGTDLKEVAVTPPALDGGEAIDVTTMRNTNYKTVVPRRVYQLGEMRITAAYTVQKFYNLLQQVNTIQDISFTYPDGHTVTFKGYIREVKPDALQEGQMPRLSITIRPTLQTDQGGVSEPTW